MVKTNVHLEDFSYAEYINILKTFSGRFALFHEVSRDDAFVLMRHDVEFSVDRALKLARLEHEYRMKSTYYFQVRCNAYNIFSLVNLEKLRVIKELGHEIGLHAYVSNIDSPSRSNLENELLKQKKLWENGLDLECRTFSIHRPPSWCLRIREDNLCGMTNSYGPTYFEFSPNPKRIKYVADSRHRWDYGNPLSSVMQDRLQILTHPDEWTETGSQKLEPFFAQLELEHQEEFSQTLKNETNHYHNRFKSE